MKYLILEKPGVALPTAVVFAGPLTHQDVAIRFEGWTPTSGGFVNPMVDAARPGYPAYHCWGSSRSLGIQAKPGDGDLLVALSRVALNCSPA